MEGSTWERAAFAPGVDIPVRMKKKATRAEQAWGEKWAKPIWLAWFGLFHVSSFAAKKKKQEIDKMEKKRERKKR